MSIQIVRDWLTDNYLPSLKDNPPRNAEEKAWHRGAVWTARQVMAMLEHAEVEEDAQRLLAQADIESHR